jgi:zinc/manganese transport system ATP-binding protein
MAMAIEFQNLTLGYERHPAVHHLDGGVAQGEFLAIVGPNGAGKSTLLKGIMGELRPLSGTITLEAKQQIGYLPQNQAIDTSFPICVFDLVAMGLWHRIGGFGGVDAAMRADVMGSLEQVGLAGFARRPIGTLSGGQLQRALFARLILQDSMILLLDEPFKGIDTATTDALIALLKDLNAQGRTVLAVMHNLDLVRRHVPRSLVLAREPVAWGPTETVLTPRHLGKAQAFHAAWDEAARFCDREAMA